MKETEGRDFLSVDDLARETGVTKSFWRKQIRLKLIEHQRFGSLVRVRRTALNDFMDSRTVKHERLREAA